MISILSGHWWVCLATAQAMGEQMNSRPLLTHTPQGRKTQKKEKRVVESWLCKTAASAQPWLLTGMHIAGERQHGAGNLPFLASPSLSLTTY